MIDDKDTKYILDFLQEAIDGWTNDAKTPLNEELRMYSVGHVKAFQTCLNLVKERNKKQSMKGFSSAVYGKKVAKEAKKNPKKAGKKMEQAFRNML